MRWSSILTLTAGERLGEEGYVLLLEQFSLAPMQSRLHTLAQPIGGSGIG